MKRTTRFLAAVAVAAALSGCQSMPILEQPGAAPPVMGDAAPIPGPAVEGDSESVVVQTPEGPVDTQPPMTAPGTMPGVMPGTVMGDAGVPCESGDFYGGDCYGGDCYGGGWYGGYGAYPHRVPQCRVGLYGRNYHHAFRGPHGPPVGQVTYPYYILRGPRDFLVDNPPSIGP